MPIRPDDVYFLLVRTQFAANLGSSVRAMKNMGFHNLVLITPECEVGMEARSLSMRGASILDKARFYPSLADAARDIPLLIATTGRFRGRNKRVISPRSLARELLARLSPTPVGIVMGSEDNGLRRSELRLCQWLVEIPTAPQYPVMNLAQATAVIAYELHLAFSDQDPAPPLNQAGSQEVNSLLDHARTTLEHLSLPRRISIDRLMLRIVKIAARARLESQDIRMLHGLLSQLERRAQSRKKEKSQEEIS